MMYNTYLYVYMCMYIYDLAFCKSDLHIKQSQAYKQTAIFIYIYKNFHFMYMSYACIQTILFPTHCPHSMCVGPFNGDFLLRAFANKTDFKFMKSVHFENFIHTLTYFQACKIYIKHLVSFRAAPWASYMPWMCALKYLFDFKMLI